MRKYCFPLFPTQIIVGSRFDKLTHESFRILSGDADEGDVKSFIDTALRETDPDERRKIDSILQVSVSANKELYGRIKEGDERMCQAMRELMKDEFEEKEQETKLIDIKNVMESFGVTIEKAMESLKIPQDMWPMYTSMIQK